MDIFICSNNQRTMAAVPITKTRHCFCQCLINLKQSLGLLLVIIEMWPEFWEERAEKWQNVINIFFCGCYRFLIDVVQTFRTSPRVLILITTHYLQVGCHRTPGGAGPRTLIGWSGKERDHYWPTCFSNHSLYCILLYYAYYCFGRWGLTHTMKILNTNHDPRNLIWFDLIYFCCSQKFEKIFEIKNIIPQIWFDLFYFCWSK